MIVYLLLVFLTGFVLYRVVNQDTFVFTEPVDWAMWVILSLIFPFGMYYLYVERKNTIRWFNDMRNSL